MDQTLKLSWHKLNDFYDNS